MATGDVKWNRARARFLASEQESMGWWVKTALAMRFVPPAAFESCGTTKQAVRAFHAGAILDRMVEARSWGVFPVPG